MENLSRRTRKLKHRYKAIIFDMDGVITDTMPYHFEAWLNALSSVGIRVDCYDVYKREGQDGLATVRQIYREHHRSFVLREARQILQRKEALFKRTVRTRFIRGARPFLRYLKKSGFLLALVTGTSRGETNKILHRDLLKMFDASVTGDEVKRGKPDPAPFLKALKKLKVLPREAVVIENAPFGIEAAKKADLFCIALETSLPEKYLAKADVIFKSFAELRQAICH